MKNKEEKLQKYEDRLLKNEKSWRRARIGAIILFVIFSITLLSIYGDDLISKEERLEALITVSIWCLFWGIIIEVLSLRIRHIDSLKFHKKNDLTEKTSPTLP